MSEYKGPSLLFMIGAGAFLLGALLFGFSGFLAILNSHPLRIAPLIPVRILDFIALWGLASWGVGFFCALLSLFVLIGRLYSMLFKKKKEKTFPRHPNINKNI